jgi:hypothetical protein
LLGTLGSVRTSGMTVQLEAHRRGQRSRVPLHCAECPWSQSENVVNG